MTKLKAKIKILNWVTGAVIYESDKDTFKEAVEEAVASGSDMSYSDMSGADMRGSNMSGADMRGIPLSKLPQDYVNQCSRDILFILDHLTAEVPFLREKLIAGEVDGSQYEGDCACLIGTLANADGGVAKVCSAIPFYEKGTHNYGEMWFLNIRKGDTPENNEFAKHALVLIDTVLGAKK